MTARERYRLAADAYAKEWRENGWAPGPNFKALEDELIAASGATDREAGRRYPDRGIA